MGAQLPKMASKMLWPALFAATALKYAYYGYTYLPMVDDNNMYGTFRLARDIFRDVILHYRMYTTRPLAALLDPYIWSRFWDNLALALIIMTALHFLSCYLIFRVFEKIGLEAGFFAAAIYLLLPFGSEATYWLSASSRIVAGFFLVAFSLYLLSVYFENEGSPRHQPLLLTFFAVIHLLSLGFYEQVIAMSFIMTALIFLLRWKTVRSKWIIIIPLFNYMVIALWYKFFSDQGNMVARGRLVSGNCLAHTKTVIKSVYHVWRTCLKDFFTAGIPRGLEIIKSDGAHLFILAMLAICLAVFAASLFEKPQNRIRHTVLKTAVGLVLFATPYLPFLAVDLVWICNRNIFLSFIGLGLITEAFLDLLARGRIMAALRGVAIGAAFFVLLSANVYELYYYRSIGAIDRKITSEIAQIPGVNDNRNMFLFNAEPNYMEPSGGRIGNCTGSDWALSGALHAQQTAAVKLRYACPVPPEAYTPVSKKLLEGAILLGIDASQKVFELDVPREQAGAVYLFRTDGTFFGRLEFPKEDYILFHTE